MRGRRNDLQGRVFGKLTVIGISGHSHGLIWQCRCECGNYTATRGDKLLAGHVKTCGQIGCRGKHGKSTTPEYAVWNAMISRCHNPKAKRYPDYGGRGIKVGESWRAENGFQQFLADMGERPSASHSIERIHNDGDYTPENCRWATRSEQARNKRNTIFVKFNGKRRQLIELIDSLGLVRQTVYGRLKRGWSLDEALGLPPRKRRVA